MTKIVYEWCDSSTPHHTNRYIPEDALINKTGFQSVFGYKDLHHGLIPKSGVTPLYANKVFIDVDSLEKSASIVANRLRDQEVAHEVWLSGHKGYHFVVKTEPMLGPCIDQSIKQWISSNFGDIAGVDTSMIHARGLIRLPGTRHSKTGRLKTLVDEFQTEGVLKVPEGKIELPKEYFLPEDPIEAAEVAFLTIVRGYRFPPPVGARAVTTWRIIKTLQEGGYTANEAYEVMCKINNSWPAPKPEETVEKVVRQVYGV